MPLVARVAVVRVREEARQHGQHGRGERVAVVQGGGVARVREQLGQGRGREGVGARLEDDRGGGEVAQEALEEG